MKRDDIQSLAFIVFMFTAPIAIFVDSTLMSTLAFVSGIITATMLASDFLS